MALQMHTRGMTLADIPAVREIDRLSFPLPWSERTYRFELLENDDDEAVQRLIDEGKAEKYESRDFSIKFKKDLEHDHSVLMEVKNLWENV